MVVLIAGGPRADRRLLAAPVVPLPRLTSFGVRAPAKPTVVHPALRIQAQDACAQHAPRSVPGHRDFDKPKKQPTSPIINAPQRLYLDLRWLYMASIGKSRILGQSPMMRAVSMRHEPFTCMHYWRRTLYRCASYSSPLVWKRVPMSSQAEHGEDGCTAIPSLTMRESPSPATARRSVIQR